MYIYIIHMELEWAYLLYIILKYNQSTPELQYILYLVHNLACIDYY